MSTSPSQPETETDSALAPLFKVVLFDDDEHTYDYVVELLVDCCSLSRESAFRCAVEVDLSGRTTVFYGTGDECRRRRDRIVGYGADPRLPRSRGSMKAEVQGR
ncbi:MAG TPA: ATP-dependent Clp protease adaptor ClpS [Fibrobacteria bacterium]|nr:ATP-dependent Clp protease adaptor ClpS [Fibrobacteria bacterium]